MNAPSFSESVVTSGAGAPSSQFHVVVRSSLPGSNEDALNGITCPSCATNVAIPLIDTVPARSITAVGSTLVIVTDVTPQGAVVAPSSSVAQTVTS